MQARELMTKDVLTVSPDTPVRRIAELLLAHGVSAVPVVEADGAPIGIISETDLVARSGGPDQRRNNWCVRILAGRAGKGAGEPRPIDTSLTARDVMSAPLVTVTEEAEAAEIIRLLTRHRIKRLPVVRAGRVVGIISRPDLLRALAAASETDGQGHHPQSALGAMLSRIDRLFHGEPDTAGTPPRPAPAPEPLQPEAVISAADFQASVTRFKQRQALERAELRHRADERHKHDIEAVLGTHISEDTWRHMLLGARIAAEHGEKEYMALRIPRETCSDNGRAINVGEHGWQTTLRGEGAELWLRFSTELAPRGFHLVARTLEYPDGVPGDIGLFLVWGAA